MLSSFRYKITVTIICAGLFFVLTMPFRMLFSLFTITEIRPVGALTPVLGLLFGPWGALAAAIGNFAADIICGYPPFIYILGFFFQFLYGYIPYKLWHIFSTSESERVSLKTMGNIIKYTLICLCSVIMMAFFLHMLLSVYGWHIQAHKVAFFAFFNNSIFCIILGIPLLIWAQRLKLTFFMPRKKIRHKAVTVIFFSLFLACVVAFLVTEQLPVFGKEAASFFFPLSFVLVCLSAGLFPADGGRLFKNSGKKAFSLTEQIISFFLVIGITGVIISAATSFYDNYTYVEMSDLWDELFFTSCISLYVLFALIFVILRFVERVVTVPVEQLSDIMVAFASSSHTKQESERLIEAVGKIICKNSEIHTLEKSLIHTIAEVQDYTQTLERVTTERERLGAELAVAAQIQLSCLPQVSSLLTEVSPFDLNCFILPAKEVGGDFYDFFYTEKGQLVLIIADVAGKGVPAALFMMQSKTLIREYARFGLRPGDIFTRVNECLLTGNDTGMFVTAFMAVINTQNGECVCVNAGHNPPFFRRAAGSFSIFESTPASMLAGFNGTIYKETILQLSSGDEFFLYTDGVTEALKSGNEFFGEERLQEALNSGESAAAEESLTRVKNALASFVGDEPQSDDMTMLSFIYQPRVMPRTFVLPRRS